MPDATSSPTMDPAAFTSRFGGVGRVLAVGLIAAAVIGVGGHLLVAWRLGDDAAVRAGLERDARQQIARVVERLQQLAGTVARQAPVRAALRDAGTALRDSSTAPRRLFAALDGIVDPDSDGPALTIHNVAGQPVAWSGRPSELPKERVLGGADLFVGAASLGLRLVAIEPIAESSASGRRIGAVVAEAHLSTPDAAGPRDSFVVETAYGPVVFTRAFVEAQASPRAFVVRGPSGAPLLTAEVGADAPALARARWRGRVDALALAIVVLTLVAAAGLVALERTAERDPRRRAVATGLALAFVAIAWGLTAIAIPRDRTQEVSTLPPGWAGLAVTTGTPGELAATGLALLAAMVLLVDPVRRTILATRRRPGAHGAALVPALLVQLAAGLAAAGLQLALVVVVQQAEHHSAASLVRFALTPWDASRLARLAGLILLAAAGFWAGVLVCRLALTRWRWPADGGRRILAVVAWLLPALVIALMPAGSPIDQIVARWPIVVAVVAVAATAWITRRGIAWFRHGSQASRLGWLLVALLVPAWLLYPVLVDVVERTKAQLVEDTYATQVRQHPEDLRRALDRARQQIDRFPGLEDLVASSSANGGGPSTGPAFTVWRETDLEQARLTSAIELYGADGRLVSRFALNFPEYRAAPRATQKRRAAQWEVFGEAQPFGVGGARHAARRAQRLRHRRGRRHEGRDHRRLRGARLSAPAVHPLAGPVLRGRSGPPSASDPLEGTPGSDVEFAVYGWGLIADLHSGQPPWPLTTSAVRAALPSRQRAPFWTTLARGDGAYQRLLLQRSLVHLRVGYPILTLFDSPRAPRRADDVRRRAVRVLLLTVRESAARARWAAAVARPLAAPRDPRQLLPQAVPRLRARVDLPVLTLALRDPRLLRRACCVPTSRRRRCAPPRSAQRVIEESRRAPCSASAGATVGG